MTLTETAIFTKKFLVFAAIFLFLSISTWVGWNYYYYNIYLPSLPKVEEKPNTNFGILPQVKFPPSKAPSSNFTYSLDTETGEVPKDFPKIIKVYSIAQLATDLLALDRAKNLSFILGFNKDPEMLTSNQYRFINEKTSGELIINLDSGNFKFRRQLASDSAELEDVENFINEDTQGETFKKYLSSKNLLKDQLVDGKTKVFYDSPIKKDSKTANIGLWQNDVDKIPVLTTTFKDALIRGVVSNYRDETRKFIQLEYTFWPIDLENFATYPTITGDEALEALKNGEGNIAVEHADSKVSINKVYLAYVLSEDYYPYLEPFYVFEGTEFAAFVPAIKPDFLEKN